MENMDELKVNDRISFSVLDPYDNNRYEGTITSLCSYSVARTFKDLVPTYENIKKVLTTLPPIENLNYLIVQIVQSELSQSLVVAKEWIDVSSLILLDFERSFDIRVYDRYTASDIEAAITLLKSHGFKCSQI